MIKTTECAATQGLIARASTASIWLGVFLALTAIAFPLLVFVVTMFTGTREGVLQFFFLASAALAASFVIVSRILLRRARASHAAENFVQAKIFAWISIVVLGLPATAVIGSFVWLRLIVTH